MAIHRLNHAVLFVSDLDRSVGFYCGVLGFTRVVGDADDPATRDAGGGIPGAAFLRAPASTNDHDLGLFAMGGRGRPAPGPSGAGRNTVGLYHLAWEVETLADLIQLQGGLAEAGALVGASDHSTTKSLYGQDPDGLEFEICWIVPADQLDDAALAGRDQIRPLDLAREIARYGADTQGGIGISRLVGSA